MEFFTATAPLVVFAAAAVVFPVLFFVSAPYGRHARPGFGPTMPARAAWMLMESPSVFLFAALWWLNPGFGTASVTLLGLAWLVHYVQRTFVFSLLMRGEIRQKPLFTVGLALAFNVLNAGGNAASLPARPVDLPLVVGLLVFAVGLGINLHSDHVLRTLRGPGETGYKVPQRGLHRWVSAPNYLGEIVEWTGFAIAAQTLPAWAFVAFTVANLAPRAWSHRKWYRAQFADYPADRRALVPYLW